MKNLKTKLLSIAIILFAMNNANAQLKLVENGKVVIGGGEVSNNAALTVNGGQTIFQGSFQLADFGVFHGTAAFWDDVTMHENVTISKTATINGTLDLTNANVVGLSNNEIPDHLSVSSLTSSGSITANGTSYLNHNVVLNRSAISSLNSNTLTVSGSNEVGYYAIKSLGSCYTTGIWKASDERLKKDIAPIENSLSKLMKVSGKSYAYKNSEELQELRLKKSSNPNNNLQFHPGRTFGVLAQEIEPVLPELVHFDSTDGTYAVQYEGFIPLLIEGLKEQQKQIEALNKRVSVLEIENSKLRDKNNKKQSPVKINSEPQQAALKQNYPNPFNEETTIEFYLPSEVNTATLYIYDLQGKQLKSIDIIQRENGSVTIYANELMPGMYKYALLADGEIIGTETMILTE